MPRYPTVFRSLSLERKIQTVELRLALCQRTTHAHSQNLKRRFGEKLTSPLTWIVAAGVGAALWYFRPRAKPSANSANHSSDQASAATSITDLLAMADHGLSLWASLQQALHGAERGT